MNILKNMERVFAPYSLPIIIIVNKESERVMMERFFKRLLIFTTVVLYVLIYALPVQANNSPNFSVSVNYPEAQNQEVGESGFFDLVVESGKTYDLSVTVNNLTKEKITVVAKVVRAGTNSNGVLDYKVPLQESIKLAKKVSLESQFDFNNLIEDSESKLTIDPQSSVDFKMKLTIPNEKLPGEILGGVYFKEEKEVSEEDKEKMIINTFSYSIPIVINRSSEENKVENELHLGEVAPELRNSHPFIEAELINTKPSIIRNMKIDGQIIEQKSKEVVYVKKEDSYQMAPHSILNYGFDLEDNPIKPGKYEAILKVNADEQYYELKKEFEIEKKEAKKFNENSVFILEDDKLPTWVYILIVMTLLLLVIVFVRYRKKK
ncbi:DUF916 and DUF3324 domain-containing protein [Vagococcus lutrae]|uniref:DUF916 and DUF3324 domain-containing protein n=1 Tax=Vagococcus lutrae TaxID=81947 RepID=UPI001C9419F2|nr:DUF916 and DUF3324 domain-containing protein [Vagococcus lutrae]QZN89322.1 DUF916 and DUF3324 domain-containing protein [Vagococcus lutrae]